MLVKKNTVSVHQAPSEISSYSQPEFLRTLEMSTNYGHPRFVLDCSKLKYAGTSEIRFLLGCLEEVMKHNGDVRLAALRPEVKTALQKARIDRLFEMYETTESAVHSYQLSPVSMPSSSLATGSAELATEYAA